MDFGDGRYQISSLDNSLFKDKDGKSYYTDSKGKVQLLLESGPKTIYTRPWGYSLSI